MLGPALPPPFKKKNPPPSAAAVNVYRLAVVLCSSPCPPSYASGPYAASYLETTVSLAAADHRRRLPASLTSPVKRTHPATRWRIRAAINGDSNPRADRPRLPNSIADCIIFSFIPSPIAMVVITIVFVRRLDARRPMEARKSPCCRRESIPREFPPHMAFLVTMPRASRMPIHNRRRAAAFFARSRISGHDGAPADQAASYEQNGDLVQEVRTAAPQPHRHHIPLLSSAVSQAFRQFVDRPFGAAGGADFFPPFGQALPYGQNRVMSCASPIA